MSRSGKDLPNAMWQDEETYRRHLNLAQLQQQQHQHNMQFNVPSVGNDLPSHHSEAANNSLYMPGNQQSTPSVAEHLYSVLPMGNGNYLKVYHNQDDNMKFQNYELFSSNSYIPQMTGQMGPSIHTGQTSNTMLHHQQQQQQPAKTMFPQHQQMFYDHSASHSNSVGAQHQSPPNQSVASGQDDNTNNLFINQLVENWVPNVSGTYSPFGEPAAPQHLPMQHHEPGVQPEQFNFVQQPSVLAAPVAQHPSQLETSSSSSIHRVPLQPQAPTPSADVITSTVETSTPTSSGTNGSFQMQNEEFLIKKSAVTPKKPRMVAEVKPMRKTYADVVSKNVLNKKEESLDASGLTGGGLLSSASSSPNADVAVGGNSKSTASKLAKDNKAKQQHVLQSQGKCLDQFIW